MALLAAATPPDQQLKALLDFVDINDPSMVNVLYQSFSRMYEKMAKNQYSANFLADEVKLTSVTLTDLTAKKFYDIFRLSLHQN